MKYFIEAQYLPKGADRPVDAGVSLGIATDDKGFTVIPAVGDYVDVSNGLGETEGRMTFSGKVRSRLFRYLLDSCLVNIVVEETDDDFGQLVKE